MRHDAKKAREKAISERIRIGLGQIGGEVKGICPKQAKAEKKKAKEQTKGTALEGMTE